jgi:hypothetical protein
MSAQTITFVFSTISDDSVYHYSHHQLLELMREASKTTDFFESELLRHYPDFRITLSNWIEDKHKKWRLIYRASRDGYYSKDFHKHCDKKGETVTLIKGQKGTLFGGYTPIPWTSDRGWHFDARTFLFSLRNLAGNKPLKMPHISEQQLQYSSTYHEISYGPCFGGGCDICK